MIRNVKPGQFVCVYLWSYSRFYLFWKEKNENDEFCNKGNGNNL